MNFLNGMYVKAMNQFDNWKKDERGSQTLEWLGIAAVIVIVVGFVSGAFTSDFGDKVKEKFEGFVDTIAP